MRLGVRRVLENLPITLDKIYEQKLQKTLKQAKDVLNSSWWRG